MKKDKVLLTRVDEDTSKKIDFIISNSKDLNLTKSEVIEMLLYAFFKMNPDSYLEKMREMIIKNRKGLI